MGKESEKNSTYNIYACFVTQPCLTLCDPVDCSPPGSSVYGILQARMFEWIGMPSPPFLGVRCCRENTFYTALGQVLFQ